MKVAFPDPKNLPLEIPPEEAQDAHKMLLDLHLHYMKKQSDQNRAYLKFFAVFFLVSLALFLLQAGGVVSDFRIGTFIMGIGTLAIIVLNSFFISPQYDRKVDYCIQRGMELEKRYPSIVNSGLFQSYGQLETYSQKVILLSRLLPFIVITLLTIIAGISLIF